MRVKVGSTWHEAKPGVPIMVELTDLDKRLIADMRADAKCYAAFDDHDSVFSNPESMRRWMRGEG